MALKSASMGTLLQGVNQQPARVRLEGQVGEQINLISDITTGLSTRPGTKNVAKLEAGDRNPKYQVILFKGKEYIVSWDENSSSSPIKITSAAGDSFSVVDNSPSFTDYVGEDIIFTVVENRIVATNRDKTVETLPLVGEPTWRAALFQALGGEFLRTYTVSLSFSDGAGNPRIEVEASYSTPDGTGTNDGDETSSDYIIEQLVTDLLANVSLPALTEIERVSDVANVYHPTRDIEITVSDGSGGTILRGFSSTTKNPEDLSRYAPNGKIVEITASPVKDDNYWLRFETTSEFGEDGKLGFGEEGVWKEHYNPYEVREYDKATMPHVITLDANGTEFTIDQGPWLGRQVGDNLTSPFSSIVGAKIRDATGFEGRLALLTKDTLVMSRTNEPFDLWRESATIVSASDVVDIQSTKKNSLGLSWLVPFDRDLFIMSDPGASQFIVKGGGITPDNASMVLTTEFEITSGGARPQSTGRTILFPFSIGSYSGVKEFYTSTDVAVNAANSLTETQTMYIDGLITQIEISQNFNIAMFRAETLNTIWVYKYLWDSNEVLQSSWSKWVFRDEIRYMFFSNSLLYLVSKNTSDEFYLHYLDLNRPQGTYGYTESLDRRRVITTVGSSNNASSKVVVTGEHSFIKDFRTDSPGLIAEPIPDAILLLDMGGSAIEDEETPETYWGLEPTQYRVNPSTLEFVYEFDLNEVPIGASLIAGHPIYWEVEPTQAFGRDYQQRIDTSKNVTVQEYAVHVENSGTFKAFGKSPYSSDWEYNPFEYIPPEVQRSDVLTHTGTVYIPWGERADWSTFTIQGSDVRETTILEVEWIGQVINTKGRRQ